jgi:hypothetical protein
MVTDDERLLPGRAQNPLCQLTVGAPSSSSSESSEISINSSAVRLPIFFLAPLWLEGALMTSRNWSLLRLEWSFGASAVSGRKSRSLYASYASVDCVTS